MSRAAVAQQTPNIDFWPGQSLSAWQADPGRSFEDWLAQLRVNTTEQFRESSRDTYKAMFSWWLASLTAKGIGVLEATPQDATNFFACHEVEALSRRRYLQLLDRVYRHLQAIGWKGLNPMQVELKKERQLDIALPPGLPEDDVNRLIVYLSQIPGWKGFRDRGMAALLLGAGLRVNEFLELGVREVNEQFEIHIRPEGVHRRHVTLVLPDGPWRGWLRRWEAERDELAIPGKILCPGSVKGTVYTPSGLFRRVSGWLEGAGIEADQRGPNLLRNTFARLAIASERYSLEQVKEFLGHEDLRATSRHIAALNTLESAAKVDIC